MTAKDPGRLLGGHAPGTLTEAERKALYGAALEDQALFDALMDEEALRELLADPAARAQVLEALAPADPAPAKVRPLWRRPGVLGAAASLLVAATAGLVYLRETPAVPPLRPAPTLREAEPSDAVPAPAPSPAEAPPPKALAPEAPAPRARKAEAPPPVRQEPRNRVVRPEAAPTAGAAPAAPPPPPPPAPLSVSPSPRPAAAVVEVVAQEEVRRAKETPAPAKALAPGVAAGLAADATARASEQAQPTWTLVPQPDGLTRVTVLDPRSAQVVLLKRGPGGVVVLEGRASAAGGGRTRWEYRVRLGAGEVLDLYRLDAPVADPAALPETGPVAGFRARIHPAAN